MEWAGLGAGAGAADGCCSTEKDWARNVGFLLPSAVDGVSGVFEVDGDRTGGGMLGKTGGTCRYILSMVHTEVPLRRKARVVGDYAQLRKVPLKRDAIWVM